MPKRIDRTGEILGKYKILYQDGLTDRNEKTYTVQCMKCGFIKHNQLYSILKRSANGKTCRHNDNTLKLTKKATWYSKRLRAIYTGMLCRCNNPKHHTYPNYGGRGIKVCDEWHDFSKFKEWVIKTRPQEDYTVERIDVDGDYCPSNCTWIPLGEQARNRRTNVIIEYNGEKHILVEWCEILNLNYNLIHNRIHKLGWSFEQAISTPLDKSKRNKVERKSNGRILKQSNTSG